jgi:dsRNA-specific ribonuclease
MDFPDGKSQKFEKTEKPEKMEKMEKTEKTEKMEKTQNEKPFLVLVSTPVALKSQLDALELAWKLSGCDSFTLSSYQKEKLLIFFVKKDEKRQVYKAYIRSPGLMSSRDDKLHSEWHTKADAAIGEATRKALIFYEEHHFFEKTKMNSDEMKPYDVQANLKHDKFGEQEVMPFSSLHGKDLSSPDLWPSKLRLIRIVPSDTSNDSLGYNFGLLTHVHHLEDRGGLSFGLSLEWCKGTNFEGSVRMDPQCLKWAEQKWKIQAGKQIGMNRDEDPQDLILSFHNATILTLFPEIQPVLGGDSQLFPASALLVRLFPDDRLDSEDNFYFDWVGMRATIEERRVLQISKIYNEYTDEFEDKPEPLRLDFFAKKDLFSASSNLNQDGPDGSDGPGGPQFWLLSLLHRWYRLYDLEVASFLHGPIFPVLSPLMLEAAMTLPITGVKDVPFEVYKAIGAKALEVLVAVTTHAQLTDSHHTRIIHDMATFLPRGELAALIQLALPYEMMASAVSELKLDIWSPPGVRIRVRDLPCVSRYPSDEESADIAEALLGAYYMTEGGSFSSAWRFVQWLLQHSHAHVVANEFPQVSGDAVLGHLLFGAPRLFRGRTSTYLNFYESEEDGEKILKMYYADGRTKSTVVFYRRAAAGQNFAEEFVYLRGSKWEPLLFSPNQGVFFSKGSLAAVPNKVSSWLLGKSSRSMITWKTYTGDKEDESTFEWKKCRSANEHITWKPKTPDYCQLQETRSGCLKVNYTDYGWFTYQRTNDGSFGTEVSEDNASSTHGNNASSLMYSEGWKTLTSMNFERHRALPLPNKVTDWLLGGKCLCDHVPLKKIESPAAQEVEVLSSVTLKDDGETTTWLFQNEKIILHFELFVSINPRTQGSILFVERRVADDLTETEEELVYSEEMKTWLSPFLTRSFHGAGIWKHGVPLPLFALDCLKVTSQRVDRFLVNKWFRCHYFRSPWCKVPFSVSMSTGREAQFGKNVESHTLFGFVFRNPSILQEALTHASVSEAKTTSNTKLATLGKSLIEMLLTQEIVEQAKCPLHLTHFTKSALDGEEKNTGSKTFAVTALVNGLVDTTLVWPIQGERAKILNEQTPCQEEMEKAILQSINDLCTHLTFALMCSQSGLHQYILHSSLELQEAISSFVNIAEHASEDPDTMRLTVTASDAPRMMSDTFLAVAAAVFLDSDYITYSKVFKSIICKHVDNAVLKAVSSRDRVAQIHGHPACRDCSSVGFVGVEFKQGSADWKDFMDIASGGSNVHVLDPCRGRAFDPQALSLVPSPSSIADQASSHQHIALKWRIALSLRDFHLCKLQVDGIDVGPPIGASSPRSATQRCSALMMGDERVLDSSEAVKECIPCKIPSSLRPDLMGKDAGSKKARLHLSIGSAAAAGAAFRDDNEGERHLSFCFECQKVINGPLQMEDHLRGKQHLKNMARILKEATPSKEVLTKSSEVKKSSGLKQSIPLRSEAPCWFPVWQ